MNDAIPTSKVPAITRAAAILRHLGDLPRPSGVTAIARAVDLNPSSCLNILRALVEEGFVIFNEETKSYAIGSAVISLARRALDPENTMAVSREVLAKLAYGLDATASLWRVTHDRRLMLVGFEVNGNDTRLHMTVGQRLPMSIGASGRSVTAAAPPSSAKLEATFRRLRWDDAPSFEAYLEDIRQAQLNGWALDRGAFRRGVTSVASAVCDENDQPQFSVSAALLGAHHDAEFLERAGLATLASASLIRQALYGTP